MMKKSDLSLLRQNIQRAVEPPLKKKEDASDELSKLFDDGTVLESQKTAPPITEPTPRTPPTSRTPRTPPTNVAPERDFAKVANSIVRDAVAGGYFTGKSKQLYDYLYSRTRAAIVPARSVEITKPQLMKGSGIGSERTLLKNLNHLRSVGLIQIEHTDGKHVGNKYVVLLPEEVGLPDPRTPPTPPRPRTPRHAPQKVGYVPPLESGVRGVGIEPLESIIYGQPKTFIKDSKKFDDDDAAATALFTALRSAEKEITGKSSIPEQWRELDEFLSTELRIAAARTTVSSVPAFLTEHLRRRLWKMDKKQANADVMPSGGDEGTAVSTRQAKECADCGGTDFYYPNGFEGGVARCKHEQLRKEDE
jgi:hypothetical protein